MLYIGYGFTNRADFRIILGSLGLLIISDLKIFMDPLLLIILLKLLIFFTLIRVEKTMMPANCKSN